MVVRKALAVLLIGLVFMVGCSRIPSSGYAPVDLSNRKARVVVTTTMIADLARQIGGEHVEVTCLMNPGVDPHSWQSSADDSKKMQQADLIVYNGLHLEAKVADIFDDMSKHMRVVALASAIPETELRRATGGYEGAHDPHIWFDVSLWAKTVNMLRDALIELDPKNADTFRANAERHYKELLALHEEVKTKLSDKAIPSHYRVLITAHDAFFYFGRAYKFEVRGLQGISTNDQPSTRAVRELADFIAERRIPAIFGETSVPPKGIEAVQEAVQKRPGGFKVRFYGESLYSDSLGDLGGPAGTYVGMIRHNVETIAKALGQ